MHEPTSSLKTALEVPMKRASLGPRHHALLATLYPDAYRKALERDDWTCCECGVRLPGWMEVHHLNHNHGPLGVDASNLAPICPFCHTTHHHPSSGADLGLFDLIWWPELDQRSINRIAWAFQAARRLSIKDDVIVLPKADRSGDRPLSNHALETVVSDAVRRRCDKAAKLCGSGNPLAVLETLHRLLDKKGEPTVEHIFRTHLYGIRLWPTGDVPRWNRDHVDWVGDQIVKSVWDAEGGYPFIGGEQPEKAFATIQDFAKSVQPDLAKLLVGSGSESR